MPEFIQGEYPTVRDDYREKMVYSVDYLMWTTQQKKNLAPEDFTLLKLLQKCDAVFTAEEPKERDKVPAAVTWLQFGERMVELAEKIELAQ